MIFHPYYQFTNGGAAPVSQDQSTPGRIRESYEYYRKAREEEARRERASEAPAATDGRLAEYTEKSAKIAAAISRLRDETIAFQNEKLEIEGRIADQKRKAGIAAARKALLIAEQELQLRAAQEAALLEELQVIDIAYVSIIALGAILQ